MSLQGGSLVGKLTASGTLHGILSMPTGGEPYTGERTVTPSLDEQTLHTAGKTLTGDITIEAIPEIYGLVTYDQNRVLTIT